MEQIHSEGKSSQQKVGGTRTGDSMGDKGVQPLDDLNQGALPSVFSIKSEVPWYARIYNRHQELREALEELGTHPRCREGIVEIVCRFRSKRSLVLISELAKSFSDREILPPATSKEELQRSYRLDSVAIGQVLIACLLVDLDKALAESILIGRQNGVDSDKSLKSSVSAFLRGHLLARNGGPHIYLLGGLLVRENAGKNTKAESLILKNILAPVLDVYGSNTLLSSAFESTKRAIGFGRRLEAISRVIPVDLSNEGRHDLNLSLKGIFKDKNFRTKIKNDFIDDNFLGQQVSLLVKNFDGTDFLSALKTFLAEKVSISDRDLYAIVDHLQPGLNWGQELSKDKTTVDNRVSVWTHGLLLKHGYTNWGGSKFEPLDRHLIIRALAVTGIVYDRERFCEIKPKIKALLEQSQGWKDLKSQYQNEVFALVDQLHLDILKRQA